MAAGALPGTWLSSPPSSLSLEIMLKVWIGKRQPVFRGELDT
jgi:hypothetical protein